MSATIVRSRMRVAVWTGLSKPSNHARRKCGVVAALCPGWRVTIVVVSCTRAGLILVCGFGTHPKAMRHHMRHSAWQALAGSGKCVSTTGLPAVHVHVVCGPSFPRILFLSLTVISYRDTMARIVSIQIQLHKASSHVSHKLSFGSLNFAS